MTVTVEGIAESIEAAVRFVITDRREFACKLYILKQLKGIAFRSISKLMLLGICNFIYLHSVAFLNNRAHGLKACRTVYDVLVRICAILFKCFILRHSLIFSDCVSRAAVMVTCLTVII